MTLLAIERHALGPRVHVLGRRVHECHLGLALAAVALLGVLASVAEPLCAALAVLAAWLLVKDWRDLHRATRDTAAWSLGLHRRPDGVPAPRARDRVPVPAAAGTAVVGAVNVASVMAGDLPARARAVLALAPAGEVRLAHALALPAGLALLGVAWPLARRRRRALQLAVVLLAALGVVDVVKSLDFEVAAASWALAGAAVARPRGVLGRARAPAARPRPAAQRGAARRGGAGRRRRGRGRRLARDRPAAGLARRAPPRCRC